MRILLTLFGAILLAVGAIWFLQGINVFPGAVAAGRIRWSILGAIAVVAGFIFLRAGGRRRNRARKPRPLLFQVIAHAFRR